jgi:hypothetical protein
MRARDESDTQKRARPRSTLHVRGTGVEKSVVP